MRRLKTMWLLMLLMAGAVGVAGAETVRIIKWEPMGGPPEPAYIHLEVALPCDLKEPREEFTVNGQPAVFTHLGFSSGSEGCSRDYALYVGPPGTKHITFTLTEGGRRFTASTTLDFRSRGAVVLLDRLGQEALREPGEWRLWVYFVKNLKVTVNGTPQPLTEQATAVSPHHTLVSFRPSLRPGPNLIVVEAEDAQGGRISREYRPYYLKDGQIRVKDEMLWPYGYMGSKSGPFFRLEVEGEALKITGQQELDQAFLKDQAWFAQKRLFLKKIRAQQPGEVTLKVYKKSWFTNPYQLEETHRLRVIP
jgi:hypothetical protein